MGGGWWRGSGYRRLTFLPGLDVVLGVAGGGGVVVLSIVVGV